MPVSTDAKDGMKANSVMVVRDASPEDLGFIYATWLKGLYYGNDWFRQIDQELYYDRYHQVVESILFKKGTVIKVACLKEDQDVMLGYAVYEAKDGHSVLHWAFTKPAWRKLGVARALIPENTTVCTHLTKIARSIKPNKWKFDPFLS